MLDYFRLISFEEIRFYFASLAVFPWGQNLFNEKKLQASDGLVPRSGKPDAQFLTDGPIFLRV